MDRRERLARNERRIREVNEEAELVARDVLGDFDPAETEVEFLCACGRARCDEVVLLSIAEYEAAHAEPHRFIVVPGHESLELERVVEEHASYFVVEKLPQFQAPA